MFSKAIPQRAVEVNCRGDLHIVTSRCPTTTSIRSGFPQVNPRSTFPPLVHQEYLKQNLSSNVGENNRLPVRHTHFPGWGGAERL